MFREIKLYTVFENPYTILLDINHFGYSETQRIAHELENVLGGLYKYEYEWSGMRASFESNLEKTNVEDMTNENGVLELNTSFIHQVFLDRLSFMNAHNEQNVLRKVRRGFELIKKDPVTHKSNDFFYNCLVDSTELNFLLLDTDLLIDVESYFERLKVNSHFLPSSK